MGWSEFQDLCREVLAEEPDAATCDLWGIPGQTQEGADLVLYLRTGGKLEVVQCKCKRKISPSQVNAASQKFLDHLPSWRKRKVRKFILVVGCSLDRTELGEEVARQRAAFGKLKLAYEAWSASTLEQKLRPHAQIVRRYCYPPEFWVAKICGQQYVPAPALPSAPGSVCGVLAMDDEQIASLLATEVNSRVEAAKQLLMEGRRQEAKDSLRSLRGDEARWKLLSATSQARVLRTEAKLVLGEVGGVALAEELAREARAKDPGASKNLEALIALHTDGPHVALETLGDTTDPMSAVLKVGLLLEAGRVEEALRKLPSGVAAGDEAAEALRLEALARIARGEIAQALVCAQKALDLRPSWIALSEVLGRIEFYMAMSEAGLPGHLEPWPAPVPWGLVKRDDESTSRLRSAEARFSRLLERSDAVTDRGMTLAIWQLACLACDQDRQLEAEACARAILEREPTSVGAVFWAGVRRFKVDWKKSAQALRMRHRNGTASVADCLALAQCRLATRKGSLGVKELREQRDLFRSGGQEPLWVYWIVELLLASGKYGEAERLVNLEGGVGDLSAAREAVLRATGKKSELLQLLQGDGDSLDGASLAEVCSLQAATGNWSYVAEHAEELVTKVGTSEAVRLASIGLLKGQCPERCLLLLERAPSFFPNAKLPNELVAARVACERALGLLPEAIKHAEELANTDDTVDNLVNLSRLYLSAADVRSAADISLKLLRRDGFDPADALRLADAVRAEDIGAAQQLWRYALSGAELPDEVFVWAYALAFRLGLESELGAHSSRFARLAQTRPELVRTGSLDDLVEEFRRYHQERAKIEAALLRGTVPGHLALPLLGFPLPLLYRFPAVADFCPDLLHNHVLMRHGSRATLAEPLPDRPSRLIVDTTALLTANELGCLDSVEAEFGPLWITDAVVLALQHCHEQLRPTQPQRLNALQELLTLLESGKLDVLKCPAATGKVGSSAKEKLLETLRWLVGEATRRDGHVVEYLPLERSIHGDVPPELAEFSRPFVTSCHGVLEALREAGRLSQPTYEKARAALGPDAAGEPVGTQPRLGATLILAGNIPEVLASAGLLVPVSESFQVLVQSDQEHLVREELRKVREASSVATRVDRLLQRLRTGIRNGEYKTLPTAPVEKVEVSEREPIELAALRGVLGQSQEPGSAFWCDDRYLSAYDHANGALIITTTGILDALRSRGRLTHLQVYAALLRLRAGNARYIPVDRDELLDHLRNARGAEAFFETPELAIERRYFTSCLADGEILQRGGACPNPNRAYGEIPFITSSLSAIRLAILEVWKTPGLSLARREAESEWLFSLVPEFLAFAPISETGDTQFLALNVAGLLVQAMDLDAATEKAGGSTRAEYVDWIERAILSRIEAKDSLFSVAVADHAKRLLRVTLPGSSRGVERQVYSVMVGKLVCDLPDVIREEIFKDQGFARFHKLGTVSLVQAGGVSFKEDEFYAAAEKAIAGEVASLQEHEGERAFSVGMESAEPLVITLSTGEESMKLADEALCVLLPQVAERERAVRSHPEWIDTAEAERKTVIAEIVSQPAPNRRVELLRAWRGRSAILHLDRLEAALRDCQRISLQEFLPPSPASVLRYLRIPLDEESEQARGLKHEVGVGLLLEEFGLVETVSRFSALPCPLPSDVFRAFDASTPDRRREAICACSGDHCSPIALLHGAVLALRNASLEGHQEEIGDAAKTLAGAILPDAVGAYKAVVSWAHAWVCEAPQARWLPAGLRLAVAYSHAEKVWRLLRSSGATEAMIKDYFEDAQIHHLLELVTRDPSTWQDASHPRRLTAESLAARGLLYSAEYGLAASEASHEPERSTLETEVIRALVPMSALRGDALGSFLAWERPDLVKRLFGSETEGAVERLRSTVVTDALESLEARPAARDPWAVLTWVLGDSRPDEPIRQKLSQVIERLDLAGPEVGKPEDDLLVVLGASLQVPYCSAPARDNLTRQISHLARRLEETEGGDSETGLSKRETQRALILEACLSAAIDPEDPAMVARRFPQLVESCLSSAPSLAPSARSMFELLCSRLPIATGKYLWPLLLRLRAGVS